MLTAHAAAGYIGAQWLSSLKPNPLSAKLWRFLGIISGLLPDIDMLYFHLIDHGKIHHHRYFTHWPICWLFVLLLSILWWHWQRSTKAAIALLISANGMIHIFLDSIVGDIWWFMPWYDHPFSLFTVPARYQPWYWNFIFHWSFGLELLVWAIAIKYWIKNYKILSNGKIKLAR